MCIGVSSGKFLGLIVRRKVIDLDLAKARAIQDMESPKLVNKKIRGGESLIFGSSLQPWPSS